MGDEASDDLSEVTRRELERREELAERLAIASRRRLWRRVRMAIYAVALIGAVVGYLWYKDRRAIADNETAVIAALRTYCGAQNLLHRTDYDGDLILEYAGPGQRGETEHDSFTWLYSVDVDGEPIGLIDEDFARAKFGEPGAEPYHGYHFVDLSPHAAGDAYNAAFTYGLCAFPAEYGVTGLHTFIVDVQGTVFEGDCEGRHFTRFPSWEEMGAEEHQPPWRSEESWMPD